jgi:ferredoxin-NADP reductase
MTIYDATLTSKHDVAEGTTAFYFSKPEGFVFKPGQAIDLILPSADKSDAEGERHAFSIVSAPFQDELCITTRMRDSAYKRSLKSLTLGAEVKIDGPFGSLTLHNKSARAGVFIAGGIGITPFISILQQAVAGEPLSRQLLLVYSNRRPEDAAFLHELQELEGQNPHFRLLATMTQMADSSQPWLGATGLMDERMLKQAIGDLPEPIVYVVGPPSMVEAMKLTLGRIGIDEDDIRTEEFYGY